MSTESRTIVPDAILERFNEAKGVFVTEQDDLEALTAALEALREELLGDEAVGAALLATYKHYGRSLSITKTEAAEIGIEAAWASIFGGPE